VTEPDRRIEDWAATERDLRAALAEVEIGPEPTKWVNEYLDHNELGLAFETLVEALDRLGTNTPAAAVARLRAAYERMERPAEGSDAWERIRQRADS
jgi:hypothetical protein